MPGVIHTSFGRSPDFFKYAQRNLQIHVRPTNSKGERKMDKSGSNCAFACRTHGMPPRKIITPENFLLQEIKKMQVLRTKVTVLVETTVTQSNTHHRRCRRIKEPDESHSSRKAHPLPLLGCSQTVALRSTLKAHKRHCDGISWGQWAGANVVVTNAQPPRRDSPTIPKEFIGGVLRPASTGKGSKRHFKTGIVKNSRWSSTRRQGGAQLNRGPRESVVVTSIVF